MPQVKPTDTEEEIDQQEFKEEIWEEWTEIIEEDLEREEWEEEEIEIELLLEEKVSDQKEGILQELWGEEDKKKNKIKLIFY